jgi:hypothetical protein
VFYSDPSDEKLALAVERFEAGEGEFMASDIQAAATRFSEMAFRRAFSTVLVESGWGASGEVAFRPVAETETIGRHATCRDGR